MSQRQSVEKDAWVKCGGCDLYVRASIEYGPAKYDQRDTAVVRFEVHRTPSGVCSWSSRGRIMRRREVETRRPIPPGTSG